MQVDMDSDEQSSIAVSKNNLNVNKVASRKRDNDESSVETSLNKNLL